MWETYAKRGLSFHYPGHWELQEDSEENQAAISVQSPGTGFWSILLRYDCPQPEELMESALIAYQEEYEELDIYQSPPKNITDVNLEAEIEFVCWELMNTAWLKAIPTTEYTALILYQATDKELEDFGSVFDEITKSLELPPS